MILRAGEVRFRIKRQDLAFLLPVLTFVVVAAVGMVGIVANGQRTVANERTWTELQAGRAPWPPVSGWRRLATSLGEGRFYLDLAAYVGGAGRALLDTVFYPGQRLGTLPVAHLRIERDGLQELIRDLPASGRREQAATLSFDGERFDVAVRLRGDGAGHWGYEKKSWRVKLRRGSSVRGKYRRLNLINPKSRSMLLNSMEYWLARRLSLPVPDAFHVALFLNGSYEGVHLFVEQVDEYFLRSRHLPRGDVYYGEVPTVDWTRAKGWDHHVQQVGGGNESDRRLQEMLDAVSLDRTLAEAARSIPQILVLDNYIDWTVLDRLTATGQNAAFHNQKLLVDPVRGGIEHCVWDFHGHQYTERPIGEARTLLGDVFQRIPPWVEAMNQRLLQVLDGVGSIHEQEGYLARMSEILRGPVVHDTYRASSVAVNDWQHRAGYRHRDWERSINDARRFVRVRDALLREHLADARLTVRLQEQGDGWLLECRSAGWSGARLTSLVLHADGADDAGSELRVFRDSDPDHATGAFDTPVAAIPLRPAMDLTLDEVLLPGRRRVALSEAQARGLEEVLRILGDGGAGAAVEALRAVDRHRLPVDCLPRGLRELAVAGVRDTLFSPYEPAPMRYRFLITVPAGRTLRLAAASAVNHVTGDAIEVAVAGPERNEPADNLSLHPWRMTAPSAEPSEVLEWSGRVRLDVDLVVPAGRCLKILPGTTIDVAEGRGLLVEGALEAIGRGDAPIVFAGADGVRWAGIELVGRAGRLLNARLAHVVVRGADGRAAGRRGALSGRHADVQLSHCAFLDCLGRDNDGVNLSHCRVEITRCVFDRIGSDGVDLDLSTGVIRESLFLDCGADALDLGACSPIIRDNLIRGGAKGISCGEGAGPLIYNNLISGCAIGVAAKSEAIPVVLHCTVARATTAFSASAAGSESRPGWIEVHSSLVADCLEVERTRDDARVTFRQTHRLRCGEALRQLEAEWIVARGEDLVATPALDGQRTCGSAIVTHLTGERHPERVPAGILAPIRL